MRGVVNEGFYSNTVVPTPAAIWQRRNCQPGRGHESLARLYWSRDLRYIRKTKKTVVPEPRFFYPSAANFISKIS